MTNPRRKISWVAGAVVILLTLLLLGLFFTREPKAQGRPLSEWLILLDNPMTATNLQTSTALRSMGGEAAVRLVPMLDATDSRFKLELVKLARKQQFFQISFVPAAVRQQRAVTAFQIMGDRAAPAAPGLVSLLIRRGTEPSTNNYDSASRSAAALAALGYRAMPSLRPALCSPNIRVRHEATSTLQSCASDQTPAAMTEFFKLLEDGDPKVRQAASEIIRRVYVYWPRELVIARLARLLGDVNPSVRKQAAYALGRLGPQARQSDRTLRQSNADWESAVSPIGNRQSVGIYDAVFSNSVLALRQACSDMSPEVRQAAKAALANVLSESVMPGETNEGERKESQ